MILSFRTDMSGQTVQTQISLLLEEQTDQGLHCLPSFGLITLWQSHIVQILEWLQQIFWEAYHDLNESYDTISIDVL